jgi:hypothetical protein
MNNWTKETLSQLELPLKLPQNIFLISQVWRVINYAGK